MNEEKYSYDTSPGQLKVIVRTDNFESDSPAIEVLVALGVNLRQLKDELVANLAATCSNGEMVDNLQLSQRGKLVIDLANDEARNMMAKSIGTEHILLGLIREHDGLAGQALQKAGVTILDARRIVVNS
ncbi:MAG: Clp protease N-terminal domain-containing protein [Armatimonadota bacterium]